ncbi:sigma factor [Cohnella massiliensis]|uniref:sigma factor n=1 Tax=Cohnella massiliensis TaxID=1816691 RepID=UPI0009BAA029|nr:sigma factor [Cohnella massiliensis]
MAAYWYDEAGNAHFVVNAKPILLNGSEPELLTFDDIHKRFQGLIRSKAARWTFAYEFDELCQVAAIALWRAYDRYDAEAFPIPFGAMAASYIKYALMGYHQKNKPKFDRKTSQIRSLCSLFDLVDDGSGEGTELHELIGEEETFTQETADRLLLEKLLKRIPKQQRDDIFAYVDGFTMKELAVVKDVSSQQQANRLKAAFMRFRALYIKELAR